MQRVVSLIRNVWRDDVSRSAGVHRLSTKSSEKLFREACCRFPISRTEHSGRRSLPRLLEVFQTAMPLRRPATPYQQSRAMLAKEQFVRDQFDRENISLMQWFFFSVAACCQRWLAAWGLIPSRQLAEVRSQRRPPPGRARAGGRYERRRLAGDLEGGVLSRHRMR